MLGWIQAAMQQNTIYNESLQFFLQFLQFWSQKVQSCKQKIHKATIKL